MKQVLKKYGIIILFTILVIVWYIDANFRANIINIKSLVTVGVISESSSNNMLYRYKYQNSTYTGFYYFNSQKHVKKAVGEKIYVRFNPDNPNTAFMALYKNKNIEIVYPYSFVMDSLNKEKVRWWNIPSFH